METLQLSQVLADLSSLGAAEPEAASAIVNANHAPMIKPQIVTPDTSTPPNGGAQPHSSTSRPSALSRALSHEAVNQPMVDKFGRRVRVHTPGSRSGSNANSTPGTPRNEVNHSNLEEDLERASTLMALYDIRAKLKQQDNSSLLRAREKINQLAARQQARQASEQKQKAADELRRNRYSFPKPGL